MRHFKIEEFDCQETGENEMQPEYLEKLNELREVCGFPFVITSGYRSTQHSREAVKERPGTHTKGIAADIAITSGSRRYQLVSTAIAHGFTGIGIAKTFIHLDTRTTTPVIWTYG